MVTSSWKLKQTIKKLIDFVHKNYKIPVADLNKFVTTHLQISSTTIDSWKYSGRKVKKLELEQENLELKARIKELEGNKQPDPPVRDQEPEKDSTADEGFE